MGLRDLQVGVGREHAARVSVDHAVERVDGGRGFVHLLVAAGGVHQGERRVVAVGCGPHDGLEIFQRLLAIAEAREPAKDAGPLAREQLRGDAVLLADDLREFFRARVTREHPLVGIEGLEVLRVLMVEAAGAVEGLGGEDGIGVFLGNTGVELEGGAVMAGFLGGARLVHQVEAVAAFLAAQTGERAAFDFPAALRGPDEVGSEPGGNKQQHGEGCQEKSGSEAAHESSVYHRIRVEP